MLIYGELRRNPALFISLTGVTPEEFERQLLRLTPVWEAAEQARCTRPDRRRAAGGGRPQSLSPANQLLMVLVWLHLQLTTDALGTLFGIHKSTVSRTCRRLVQLMDKAGDTYWPAPPVKYKAKNLRQVLREHPGLAQVIKAV